MRGGGRGREMAGESEGGRVGGNSCEELPGFRGYSQGKSALVHVFNCYMYIHIQNVAVRMCPSLPPSLPLSIYLPQVEYNSTLRYSVYVGASEAKFQAEVSKAHTYTNMLYAQGRSLVVSCVARKPPLA